MNKNALYSEKLIADYSFQPQLFQFPHDFFTSEEFLSLPNSLKKQKAFEILLNLLIEQPTPCFLLPAVVDFAQKLNELKVVEETLYFSHFELWLNYKSQLSKKDQAFVRGKIMGKYLPHEEYQYFFPIGMGKNYPGTHFVCAHPSPDIDTFVSSFIGWLDAFAAQVSTHLHVWNIPGGNPPKQIVRLFEGFFGKGAMEFLAESFHYLNPRALDVMKPSLEDEGLESAFSILPNVGLEEIFKQLERQPSLIVKEVSGDVLGKIEKEKLHSSVLGTLSFRDFSNKEEVKYSSHLEIISIIDHHRSHLKTAFPPVCIMGDVQSTNVLIAELLFPLYDRYEKKTPYFVDPYRLYIEYFLMLIAILDDTDLLNKVTARDVECVAHILNRLKSLSGSSTLVADLEHLNKDERFAKNAARYLLKNEELYCIYKKIYALKEQDVEESILACFNQNDRTFFLDTKGINSRVGQTKLFAKNFALFSETRDLLIKQWVQHNKQCYATRHECDLFIHMISTIPGAEEMFHGEELDYSHSDELWFWIPASEKAYERLDQFLNGFKGLNELKYGLGLEILGKESKEIVKLFYKHLPINCPTIENLSQEEDFCVVVLKVKPGTINSRKASIAPFIPAEN